MLFLALVLLLQVLWLSAQQNTNTWQVLAKVAYKKAYDDLLGIAVDKPLFSQDVRKLEGSRIRLSGYIIPTDGFKSHKEFVFSAFPYSSCFFCGQAGPETVVEIEARQPIDYMSDIIVLEGVLHLNSKDVNRLMYHLSDVVRVK